MRRIDSNKNPAVLELRELHSAKGRQAQGAYLVEGPRMAAELLVSGLVPTLVLASEEFGDTELLEKFEAAGADVVIGPERCVESASDTKTPQGILLAVPQPLPPDTQGWKRIIALDGIQDPGNAGAIWRLCDAAGWDALLLSEDSADPLSPKAVRASMGAVLRVPAVRGNLPQMLAEFSRQGLSVVVSCMDGDDFYARPALSSVALVIGSEARGVTSEVSAMANYHLSLPMPGKAESLNAAMAAAIMAYDWVRQNSLNN